MTTTSRIMRLLRTCSPLSSPEVARALGGGVGNISAHLHKLALRGVLMEESASPRQRQRSQRRVRFAYRLAEWA